MLAAYRKVALASLGVALATAMVPISALATARHASNTIVVYGSVLTAPTGTCQPSGTPPRGRPQPTCTFVVTPPTGSTLTVQATTNTSWVAATQAAIVAGFQVNDYVVVHAKPNTNPLIGTVVKYAPTPFAVPPVKARQFFGKFVSIATTTAPSELTIRSGAVNLLFVLNPICTSKSTGPCTRYRLNGRVLKSTPAFKSGDSYHIWSQLYNDGRQWTVTVWITRHHR